MKFEQAILEVKEDYKDLEAQKEKSQVLNYYGQVFNLSNIESLTKEQFKSFLLIKNNKHWDGIHRQGNMITKDMEKLKNALKILLNENKPLEERLNYLFPKNGQNYIKGLGRAVVTPILLVAYPDKYGVYNRRSSDGLKIIGMAPNFNRGSTFAEKYLEFNRVLKNLADKYELSFYELDNVWWKITQEEISHEELEDEIEAEELSVGFGLELHLRRFLVDNWDNTPLGERYNILTEDGEIIGEEYQTKEAGIIDILARDNNGKDWAVIELKRGRSGDAVVGQILRYIGWVEKNKASDGEKVKGIIILKETDKNIEHSLFALKDKVDISCFIYNVQFSLDKLTIQ